MEKTAAGDTSTWAISRSRTSGVWRRCEELCTSGFVDDVMFAHNAKATSGESLTGWHEVEPIGEA